MRARPAARSGAAWLFGLAATIFMIAVWGRAIVVDVDSLSEAAAPLAGSERVVDLFTGWLDEELVDAGVDPTTSDLVVEDVISGSTVGVAFGEFVSEFVTAAADPGIGGSSVDVASILQPTVPEITDALAGAGVPIDDHRVAEVVSGLDPMVVRESSSRPYVGPQSAAAGRLGIAAVLSLVVMSVSGASAVTLSEDRLSEVKALLNRVALGALSFSILLRSGSWVLDPDRGRAPVAESVSLLAESKWLVPLVIASVAAGAAAAVWLFIRMKRRRELPAPSESPTPPEGLPLIRTG